MGINSDFSIITELPQTWVPKEQLERFYQRYKFASQFVKGKRTLEIGCGGGQGLSLLKQAGAIAILGTDVNEKNLSIAKLTYKNDADIKLEKIDANCISFSPGSFDCILMFEVIYYLDDIKKVLNSCYRILAPDGILIIESANREWNDFNPSPFSTRYFSAPELQNLLTQTGFETQVYSSFPTAIKKGNLQKIISLIKRGAVKLHLIPHSMKYKKYLKRIFMGKHSLLPLKLCDSMCQYSNPLPLDINSYDSQFKVLFAVGRKNG